VIRSGPGRGNRTVASKFNGDRARLKLIVHRSGPCTDRADWSWSPATTRATVVVSAKRNAVIAPVGCGS
jgi:hypothetical protein